MNKKDYQYWTKFRASKSTSITKEEYTTICRMHAEFKKHAYFEPCKCSPKGIQRFIDDINKIYEQRENK